MKNKPRFRNPHARYDSEERAFICLICEESGFEYVTDMEGLKIFRKRN